MKIHDFTNEVFITAINLYSAPYKMKTGEYLEPISILKVTRNNEIVSIITSQVFMGKYIINRTFKFTNNESDVINSQIIDSSEIGSETIDGTNYFTPIFTMLSTNPKDKKIDWLSKFSMEDLYYFANKYVKPCSSINIETNSLFHNHCKDIFLKDENDYIIDARSFGDYGINYAKHAHTLSKLNSSTVFDPEDLEFYQLMLTKLTPDEKLLYTNNFITEHIQSFEKFCKNNPNFELGLENGKIIANQLLDSIVAENNPYNKTEEKIV